MSLSLKAKIEIAFEKLLKESPLLPSGLRVYTGADSEIQKRPCVVCCAKGGEAAELLAEGDNRVYNVTILIKGEAELKNKALDPVAVHNANVAGVQAILQVDDLADQLSAQVDEFYVFPPVQDVGEDPDIQGRAFVDTILFQLYCCSWDLHW